MATLQLLSLIITWGIWFYQWSGDFLLRGIDKVNIVWAGRHRSQLPKTGGVDPAVSGWK